MATSKQFESEYLKVGVAVGFLILPLNRDIGDLVGFFWATRVSVRNHQNTVVQQIQFNYYLIVVDHKVDKYEDEDLCHATYFLK